MDCETAQRYMDRISTQFNDHRDFLEIPMADDGKKGMTNHSCTLGRV